MENRLEIDFDALCRAYGIRVAAPGDAHYRGGDWISLPCPFCAGRGKAGNHLGFNRVSNTFSCWRCGRQGKFQTVGKLIGVAPREAYSICEGYALNGWTAVEQKKKAKAERLFRERKFDEGSELAVPGVRKIPAIHREYLEDRGFDADKLQRRWDLRFTKGGGAFQWRVIAPITYRDGIVSFIGRDVTGNSNIRYMACPLDGARRDHKDCVYGLDKSPYDSCIVVEGVFGVWRIGRGAVATFGTGWTAKQAGLIAKRFRRSYVMFDPDEKDATRRGEKLTALLASYSGHKSLQIIGEDSGGRDTGELTRAEVRELRKLLTGY